MKTEWWVIYLHQSSTIGPFTSETAAYAWADSKLGALNSDEFDVRLCTPPEEMEHEG